MRENVDSLQARIVLGIVLRRTSPLHELLEHSGKRKGALIRRLLIVPYVPPLPEYVDDLLGDWERFLHERNTFPDLIQCAVMHEQFKAIHPFLDGNGRLGRLLITLFLIERGRLPQPLLYLSAYIEAHR
ncbi:MAG: Fic family protein [Nitrospiraceae bacterium]|nr:MAG: Fic family protein [Nitrospiraceae bacterium]